MMTNTRSAKNNRAAALRMHRAVAPLAIVGPWTLLASHHRGAARFGARWIRSPNETSEVIFFLQNLLAHQPMPLRWNQGIKTSATGRANVLPACAARKHTYRAGLPARLSQRL
jgi:hypothetical protein